MHDPRAFPAQAGGLLKRSFRTTWDARGGGSYACGFVLTFIWLELRTIVRELAASDEVISFSTGQFLEVLFRFSLQSLGNTIQAFLWPLQVIDSRGTGGIALQLVCYLLFSCLLKKPPSTWLFKGSDPDSAGGVPRAMTAGQPRTRGTDDEPVA